MTDQFLRFGAPNTSRSKAKVVFEDESDFLGAGGVSPLLRGRPRPTLKEEKIFWISFGTFAMF